MNTNEFENLIQKAITDFKQKKNEEHENAKTTKKYQYNGILKEVFEYLLTQAEQYNQILSKNFKNLRIFLAYNNYAFNDLRHNSKGIIYFVIVKINEGSSDAISTPAISEFESKYKSTDPNNIELDGLRFDFLKTTKISLEEQYVHGSTTGNKYSICVGDAIIEENNFNKDYVLNIVNEELNKRLTNFFNSNFDKFEKFIL